jgi:hypothetical protein
MIVIKLRLTIINHQSSIINSEEDHAIAGSNKRSDEGSCRAGMHPDVRSLREERVRP